MLLPHLKTNACEKCVMKFSLAKLQKSVLTSPCGFCGFSLHTTDSVPIVWQYLFFMVLKMKKKKKFLGI
jgi:hypothetical protein